jgi:hypothetical protein
VTLLSDRSHHPSRAGDVRLDRKETRPATLIPIGAERIGAVVSPPLTGQRPRALSFRGAFCRFKHELYDEYPDLVSV